MASYTVPPVYAAFIWWFSTGAVLLLVGCAQALRLVTGRDRRIPGGGSLCGLAFSAGDTSVVGAYVAFTSTILLWGCAGDRVSVGLGHGSAAASAARPASRVRDASARRCAAILYHELALLACGAAIVALTWGAANQVGAVDFRGPLGAAAKRQDQFVSRRARSPMTS